MTSARDVDLRAEAAAAPRTGPRAAATGASRALLACHAAYFSFAVAALLALCLLVPRETSRAPVILAGAFGIWALATAARFVREREDRSSLVLQPAGLFIPVLIAAYTTFAFDGSPAAQGFAPTSPDGLPGLHIDQHVYFAMVLIALAAFAGWRGAERGRALETLLAVQIVLVSVMYERFLATPAAVPPIVLAAIAAVLLRLAPLDVTPRPVERAITWIAVPMTLLVVAAFISTAFSPYPGASLATAARMLSLAIFAVVVFDAVRDDRGRWLVWAAIVAPAVVEGALVTLKVLDIARVMGIDYAFRNRIELAAGVEVNPLGLSLALGILLIAGAMQRFPSAAARIAGAVAIAVLLAALIVTYSVGALLGLAAGLAVLAVFDLTRGDTRAQTRAVRFAPLALFAAIALVLVAVYALPGAPRAALQSTVDDPSTGRSRVHLWDWALRDFRANPVAGVGPTLYWPRVRHLPDFPYRDVTQIFERRRLLGTDTTQWRFLIVTHPHNLAIDIAEGMGVLGLLAFIIAAAAALRAGWRVLRDRIREDRWFTALSVAALAAAALFSTGSIGLQVALLPLPMWIGFGLVAIGHRTPESADAEVAMPSWSRLPAVRAAGVVALIALLAVFVVRPVGSLAASSRAKDRAAAGDVAGSARALRWAAMLDPLDASVRGDLADTKLRQGDATGALSWMKSADARASGYGAILVQLGQISWLTGDTAAAERYFREAARADPWQVLNADPYTPLGLLLLTRGDVEGAKSALAEGMQVSPVNANDRAWVHSGGDVRIDRAYETGGDSAAQSSLRDALERRLFLAPAATRDGEPGTLRLADVLAIVEADGSRAAADGDPHRAAEIFDSAALAYQFAGLHTEAVRVLQRAVQVEPDASFVRYDLAQSEIALGDDAAATAQLEEVVRIARGASAYDLRLGFAERDLSLIAMRADRYQEAVTLMRAALHDYRWAYLPKAYPTLAAAYAKLGQPEEAARWQRRESFLLGS